MPLGRTPSLVVADTRKDGDKRCYYCGEAVGTPHKATCVAFTKLVKVRVSFELEEHLPDSWDNEMILWYLNEGSRCKSGVIEQLEAIDKRDGCLCNALSYEIVYTSP